MPNPQQIPYFSIRYFARCLVCLICLPIFSLYVKAQDNNISLQKYGLEAGLLNAEVNCITKDNRGFIWCGTSKGLHRFDGYTFKQWNKEQDGLGSKNIKNLVLDAAGKLWVIQTEKKGNFDNAHSIKIIDTEKGIIQSFEEKFDNALSIPVQQLGERIVRDTKKVLYFGTKEGAKLVAYHPNFDFRVFPLANYSKFIPIGVSTNQTIWGIADDKGLIQISKKGEILHVYTTKKEIDWKKTFVKGNDVYFASRQLGSFFELHKIDEQGQLQKITRKAAAIFSKYTSPLKRLEFDLHQEKLWVLSQEHFLIVNANFEIELDLFLKSPSLKKDEGISSCSMYFDPLGGTWIGGEDGLYHINNGIKKEQNFALQVTDFHRFESSSNKLVDQTAQIVNGNQIELNPGDHFFRLGFSLLSYEAPTNIQYAYKIEGLDEVWTYQKEPFFRMAWLPYGKHTLKVKGQSADGHWSTKELTIPIYSRKPIYLQNWFLCLIGLLLLGLMVISIQWSIWKYKQQQKILEKEIISQKTTIRKQAKKLKLLAAAKTRFYTNLTHEFRTPITVIMGMTCELKNKSANILDKDTHKELETGFDLIQKNSEKILHLINQLLDLSKLDNGSMTASYEAKEVVGFIENIGGSFETLAENKGIRLAIYSEISELWMKVDGDKLQLIISNLLSNAIKFTSSSGKIILHISQKENRLHLKIKDTGEGIPPKDLAHIFDRFYQVDTTASRQGVGTGIGLAMVKELIDLLDGKISVKSKLGVGTEFWVILPINPIKNEEKIQKLLEQRKGLKKQERKRQTAAEERGEGKLIEDLFLKKLNNLLEKQINNKDLDIKMVASLMNMSYIKFYRKLIKTANQTPAKYLRAYRLERAKKLLLDDNRLNVSEVAYQVGYSDPNYFSRIFGEEFGQSPNSYRL